MQIIQIHPTFNCNRSCSWCAYGMRNQKKTELPLEDLQHQLGYAMQTGCRIVKISGGGEPTIYSDFIPLLYVARWLGFTIYLQTNGIVLDKQMRILCDDIRISFGDGIPFEIPKIQPDGFSYIVSQNPDYDNMNAVIEYVLENSCYVRITQDDTDLDNIPSIEEIQAHSMVAVRLIKGGTTELSRLEPKVSAGVAVSNFPIDAVRFWDAKDFHTGINPCPCHQLPLFGADGFWYPCCKTHVAKELTQGYNKSMRLGTEYPEVPYDGSTCRRCYY